MYFILSTAIYFFSIQNSFITALHGVGAQATDWCWCHHEDILGLVQHVPVNDFVIHVIVLEGRWGLETATLGPRLSVHCGGSLLEEYGEYGLLNLSLKTVWNKQKFQIKYFKYKFDGFLIKGHTCIFFLAHTVCLCPFFKFALPSVDLWKLWCSSFLAIVVGHGAHIYLDGYSGFY